MQRLLRIMAQTKVQQFYSQKSVFLTGVTGTLGTVILYQLLACFHSIGTIFVLIRHKKNESATQRLDKLLSEEIFQSVPDDQISKVKVVSGSIDSGHIVLGDLEQSVVGETDIVIHAAADVNFVSPLESAMQTNVGGTEAVIKLFLSSSRIKAFVHVSTAYINPEFDLLKEEVYRMSMSASQVENALLASNNGTVTDLKKRIIGKKITSYAFTKSLAENVVSDYSGSMPVAIVRVPLVSPSLWRPIPGYFNSLVGFNGVFVAAATGLMKYLYVRGKTLCHIAPVDICANHIILAAVAVAENWRSDKPLQVFNVANPKGVTWKQVFDHGHDAFRENPIKPFLWIQNLRLVESWNLFHMMSFFFVLIPALFCDLVSMIRFNAPRATYLCFKAYNRARISCESLQNDFKINCSNAMSLAKFLQGEDSHLCVSFAEVEQKPYYDALTRHLHKFIGRLDGNDGVDYQKALSRARGLEIVRLLTSPLLLVAILCLIYNTGYCIFQIAYGVGSKVTELLS